MRFYIFPYLFQCLFLISLYFSYKFLAADSCAFFLFGPNHCDFFFHRTCISDLYSRVFPLSSFLFSLSIYSGIIL